VCWNSFLQPTTQDHQHSYFPNGAYTITVTLGYMNWQNPGAGTQHAQDSVTIDLRNLTVTPVAPQIIVAESTPGLYSILMSASRLPPTLSYPTLLIVMDR
jgi:hypothetical protein